MRFGTLSIAISFILFAGATSALADVIAWWRFEDRPERSKLDAKLGGSESPFTTTACDVDPRCRLRTFNTRADCYPPDTSPTFIRPADLPALRDGTPNTLAAHFIESEDFYSTGGDAAPAIDNAPLEQFTIEGLFSLDTLARGNRDRYQTIVGKDGKPVDRLPFQPFVAVVGGQDDQYMSRDCLSINIIDRSGTYRTAASRRPLEAHRWYAFAAICDGTKLRLLINRFDGKGYRLEAETDVTGGLIQSAATWTVGRGMFDGSPNSWLQGMADEIRISNRALPTNELLIAEDAVARTPPQVAATTQPAPTLCVRGLADPAALLHDGVYYLYGTTDTTGFDVWSSRDLVHWEKGPRILERGANVWGDAHFWAPGIIERGGRFYLFYSANGVLPDTGGRRSTRICLAVADSPTGPFKEVVAPFPLIGRATIDPEPFIDTDGTPYLYFVADVNENNNIGQIYVARLRDDLQTIVGEPIACFSPSQPWEGGTWNEGPSLLKVGSTYVMTYSGEFWGSHDYGVGVATAPSPTGPWDKDDFNPFLRRFGGLFGTGHNGVAPTRDRKGWLIFFHAHRNDHDAARDTYVARLESNRDESGRVTLRARSTTDTGKKPTP